MRYDCKAYDFDGALRRDYACKHDARPAATEHASRLQQDDPDNAACIVVAEQVTSAPADPDRGSPAARSLPIDDLLSGISKDLLSGRRPPGVGGTTPQDDLAKAIAGAMGQCPGKPLNEPFPRVCIAYAMLCYALTDDAEAYDVIEMMGLKLSMDTIQQVFKARSARGRTR